jgi:hypothetical protein
METPRWLRRLLATVAWAEECGWRLVAELIPWLITGAMLGVVPWRAVAPFLGAGGVRGLLEVWRVARRYRRVNHPPVP